MPSTNFPSGISATTTQRTVSGEVHCNTLVVNSGQTFTGAATFSSTVTVGSGSQLVGQTYYIPVSFGTASALQQVSSQVPGLINCSIDAVYLTFSSVSALVANYTVQVGSAGAVAVATVANVTASVGIAQSLTTTAQTFDGTAASVICVRSVQGTVGDSVLTLVVRRSA